MADECKICIKEETLKVMQNSIDKGETGMKEILKVVSDIKDGYSDTKYSLLTIKDTQAAQAQNDKDNKNLFMEQFKAIKDEKIAAELKLEHAAEKEAEAKVIAAAKTANAKLIADEAALDEKKSTRKAVYVAVAVVIANTLIGLLIRFGGK